MDGVTSLSVAADSSPATSRTSSSRLSAVDLPDQLQVATTGVDPRVRQMLKKYPDVLRPNFKTKDVKHDVVHHIKTNCPPISTRPRRLAPDKLRAVKADFQQMESWGSCSRANSPWSSAITVVPKKTGEIRSCGDYRPLNAATLPDKYPIPHIQDFNQSIAKAKVFGTIDLIRAYHQIPVAADDICKTAVTTPFGNFVFHAMPFGLRNAAQTFQRFMDVVVRGRDFVYVYIDDILIFSDDEETHFRNLDTLFKRLNEFGIAINISKSNFVAHDVNFLGFRVNAAGIAPLPSRVEAIVNYPEPTTVKQLLRFLGFVNFYRMTIKDAAEMEEPLYRLMDGSRTATGKFRNHDLVWSDAARQAMSCLKLALQNATTLAHPLPDAELGLFTDASDIAMGACLNQRAADSSSCSNVASDPSSLPDVARDWQPLGFFSRKFTTVQQSERYAPYSRELLAIKEGIKYFRHQVEGRQFTVYTDHKPLTTAFTKSSPDALPTTTRALTYISQFTTDIRHVAGDDNAAADALSRIESIVVNDFTDVATAQQDDDELRQLLTSDSSLQLVAIPLTEFQTAYNTRSRTRQSATSATTAGTLSLYVDRSCGVDRPYIPAPLRRDIFNAIHNTSHPGAKETLRQLSRRFVWPDMRKQVKAWAKNCIGCQRSKVSRHTIPDATTFLVPDERFAHVHMDIIHLLPSEGFRYCLTAVDRRTRWPEAWPISDMSADTVAHTFFSNWVARFGCPDVVTTDQGRNFESQLMSCLNNLLGTRRQRTTSYHPPLKWPGGATASSSESSPNGCRQHPMDDVAADRSAWTPQFIEGRHQSHSIANGLRHDTPSPRRVFQPRRRRKLRPDVVCQSASRHYLQHHPCPDILSRKD